MAAPAMIADPEDEEAVEGPANDDAAILEDAVEDFERAVDHDAENRIAELDDIRFAKLEEQWPDEVAKQRREDGRPMLTINKLGAFIRQVVNDSRQNKPAITVHPVDDAADPETAEIYNGLIRNIEVTSKADLAYDTAIDCAVTSGRGYFRIAIDYAHDDTFEQDILIKAIPNQFSVYGDPNSTSLDSSDWNVAFITELVPERQFERKYKGKQKVDWKSGDYSTLTAPWREDKSVLVAEYWVREEITKKVLALVGPAGETKIVSADQVKDQPAEFEGWTVAGERPVKSYKVMQYVLTGAEVLEKNEWKGRFIPIVAVYGDEVNVEGKRYWRGLIRSAKDAQRMFNYWRSAATELVALAPKAPWVGEEGAFDADPNWSTANTASHPYLEYTKGKTPPQRQPFTGVPAGALQEALNASDDMKAIIGMYDASLGARSNETSGRAIMARQREGDVATFHFLDNLTRSIRHAGMIIIDLLPHVFSSERVARTIGPEGEVANVPLKTPVPVKDKDGQPVPQTGPDGRPMMQPKIDPQTQQPVLGQDGAPIMEPVHQTRIYDLGIGKYDLTVKAGPSFTSRREEAANQMVEFIRSYPAAAPLIGDLLAKNLDWPGADEIGKRLKAMLPPQIKGEDPQLQQAQAQLGEMQKALQKAMEEIQAEKLATQAAKADNSANGTKMELEERKVRVDEYRAETERFKALNPQGAPMPEEAITALVLQTIQQLLNSPDISEGEPGEMGQPEEMGAEPPQGLGAPDAPPMEQMPAQAPEMGQGESLAPPTADQADQFGQIIEPNGGNG